MSRRLNAAVAQLGPIHLADSRAAVVKRLMAMMREAHGRGARFVVFPELALTTFFPRWWMTDQAEIDRFFEREMPNAETRPLFDLAKELAVGFYLGYAELTEEDGQPRHYNTSILVDRAGRIVGRYRKIHLPGHSEHLPEAPFQHLEKRYFDVGNEGFKVWRAFDAVVGMCICNDRRWPETYRVMGSAGGRDRGARLQHADPQHPSPRAGTSADVPSSVVVAGGRLSERGMGAGGGQVRRRGRICDDRRARRSSPRPARSPPRR